MKKKPIKKKTSKKKNDKKKEKNGDKTSPEVVQDFDKTERKDFEYNNIVIRDGMVSLIKKLKRKPTTLEIAEYTGFHQQTIKAHIKKIKFKPQKSSLRVFTDDVLLSLLNSSRKGKVFSQKLWFQIMEGYIEKINVKDDSKKTVILKIDETIKKLYASKRSGKTNKKTISRTKTS